MNSIFLTRFITAALFTAVMAGSWDAWWHQAIGRDTFFEPPHLLLYSAVMAAILAGLYGWRKTKDKIWRRLAAFLVLIPLSAPLDDLWHRIFGVEDLSSPLIIWSPPHLFLIGSLAAGFITLLTLLKGDGNLGIRQFFSNLSFAGLLWLSLFLTAPVQPTGPYALLGFWGAGITAFVFVVMLLSAQKAIPSFGTTMYLVAFFFLIFISEVAGGKAAADVNITPHDHPPAWLVVFAFLAPAVFLEGTKRWPMWVRGATSGVLWGGLLFGFSSQFFKPEFQYGLNDALTAAFSSVLGGGLAGILLQFDFSASRQYKKDRPLKT